MAQSGRTPEGEEMTALDRKKKLEEIRRTTRTLDGTVDFLLTEIDLRDEALRLMLNAFSSADLMWHRLKAVSEAREALGEE